MKDSTKQLLIYGIGIGAGYFLVVKPILEGLGIIKSEQEKKKQQEEQKNIEDQLNEYEKKGLRLSKTKAEWDSIANQIYEDLRYTSLDDNKADAGYQVARVKNDYDMAYLQQSFGVRQEYLFGIPSGSPKNLSSFITSNLSRSAIDKLNANYAAKRMTFRF